MLHLVRSLPFWQGRHTAAGTLPPRFGQEHLWRRAVPWIPVADRHLGSAINRGLELPLTIRLPNREARNAAGALVPTLTPISPGFRMDAVTALHPEDDFEADLRGADRGEGRSRRRCLRSAGLAAVDPMEMRRHRAQAAST